jgi:hypothetical protein
LVGSTPSTNANKNIDTSPRSSSRQVPAVLAQPHVPDLMMQWLRVIAVQGLLAMAAGGRFAVVDGIDEGALDLGVSALTARFVG